MNLHHGSTSIGYTAVMNPDISLEKKLDFIYAKATSNKGTDSRAGKQFDKMASTQPKLHVPHWLLDNCELTKQEKAVTILLLARRPEQKDSSALQLSRICKDSSSTISSILASLIDKEFFLQTIVSNRVTFYEINLPKFMAVFTSQTRPVNKLFDHVKIGRHGFYIHTTLGAKLFQ